jgi:arabinofuranan 3-O-arabinosyltransferase
VRLLDEIEQQLSEGQRSTALSDLLTSAGIRYVMVRRDLDTGLSGSTPLLYTELTLENTPGFTQVAHFGPNLSAPSDPNRLTDFGATRPAGSVTVYQNPGWQGAAALLPTSQAVAANGSADSLTQLSAAGVGPDSPVLFGSASKQATDAHPETVLDDGVRRREFGFGGISQYSATMTATQPFTTTRAAHDYLPSPGPPLSTVKYLGIGGVSASSSGADADAILNASPENGPWSALDGRPKTAWRIGDLSGAVGQWWQVNLLHSINAPSINVAFAGEGSAYPSRIRVTTATGSLDQNLSPDGLSQPVALPAGPTQMVRITFLAVAGGSPGYGVGITAVTIAGVTAQRTLVVPNSDVPDVMSFAVAEGNRPKCLTVSDSPGCESSFVRHGEEDTTLDRSFTLSTDQAYRVHALLHLKNGPYLNNLLDRGNPLRAIASSTNSADPRNRAGAAVDGSDATGWVAAAGDRNPALTISTKRRVVLRGLRITSIADSPTSRPTRVTVAASGHRYLRTLPPDGRVRFPAVRTRSVTVVVLNATLRSTTSSLNGKTQLLPVGIGEVRLIGRHAPRPDAPVVVGVGCRAGLTMSVNGTVVPLHLKASSTAVLQGSGVTAEPCRYLSPQTFHPTSSVMLQGGDNRLTLGSTALSRPLSLVLMKVGYVVAVHPGAFPLTALQWSATNRSVRVSAPGAAILVVHENANAGWRATAGGQTLTSVMVDGWEQGWLVPAGTVGVIHLVYTPQRTVAAGLIAGAVAVLLLLGLLIVPPLWRRRPVPVSVGDGALRVVPAWIACLAAMTLLGAEAGLLIAVGALCLSRFLADDLVRSRSPWLVGGLLAVASAAEGLRTASSAHPLAGSPGVQLLCLAAIGIVLSGSLLFVGPSPGDGEPSEQRALEQVPAGSGHGGGS